MIIGKCYSAERSDFLSAKFQAEGDRYQLFINDALTASGELAELKIANRLGSIARKITLPGGSVFETTDNDAVDAALAKSTQSSGFMDFVHVLERNLALAIFAVFITIAVGFAGFKWGVPAVSHTIAHALPESANKMISSNVLEFLDKHYFEESELTQARQEKIEQHFIENIVPLYAAAETPNLTLHFRRWDIGDKHIPNALALPSGDIIATDRFIELTESQAEIDIVLLHEMGHVIERHSLEQVIEVSTLALAVTAIFGDVSWLADMGVGMGSFLVSGFYSRRHETEADIFAYQHSLGANIPPESMGVILMKMERDMRYQREQKEALAGHQKKGKDTGVRVGINSDEGPSGTSYFSTHPSSEERIRIANHYQNCFEQRLHQCPAFMPDSEEAD